MTNKSEAFCNTLPEGLEVCWNQDELGVNESMYFWYNECRYSIPELCDIRKRLALLRNAPREDHDFILFKVWEHLDNLHDLLAILGHGALLDIFGTGVKVTLSREEVTITEREVYDAV